MDTLSTFELLDFAATMRESWDSQFQYWLTVTFAMVVARISFTEKFTRSWRRLIASMYCVASFVFLGRLIIDSIIGGMYRDAAMERGALWIDDTPLTGVLWMSRLVLFVAGTAFTTYLLLRSDESDS